MNTQDSKAPRDQSSRHDPSDSGRESAGGGQQVSEEMHEEEMTLLETTQSVLWAILGVQSKRNASRDFKKGKVSHFVFIGLVFAALFIFTLVGLISIILGQVAP